MSNATNRSIEGHHVSYRYYGNTELTYGHGGVVVIASHHDKVGHRILCGVCAVPNHVNLTGSQASHAQVLIPHRYDRNAARAIADSRLHFALFGNWSEILDERVKEHARWSISRRTLTKEEVAENIEKRRTFLSSITKESGEPLSSDVIEASLTKYQRHLERQTIEDAVDPKNLHREESAIVAHYDVEDYDGDLTATDIDEIIVETIEHNCTLGRLPSWVIKNINDSIAEYEAERESDDHFNKGSIRVVSSDDGNGGRAYSFAHVVFGIEDEEIPNGFTAVGPSFASVDELLDYASELQAAASSVILDGEGIVREEALTDADDVVYDYIEDDADRDEDEEGDGEEGDGEEGDGEEGDDPIVEGSTDDDDTNEDDDAEDEDILDDSETEK